MAAFDSLSSFLLFFFFDFLYYYMHCHQEVERILTIIMRVSNKQTKRNIQINIPTGFNPELLGETER